jgi:Tfp pilus assembly protein PilO
MSAMKDSRVSTRIILAAVCVMLAVLIITVVRQFSIYNEERNILLHHESRIKFKLRRAKIKEQSPKIFKHDRAEVKRQLTLLHALLPTKIGVESFLDQFSSFAKGLRVEVHSARVQKENRDFYVEASLKMTLYGSEKDVKALIEKQLKEKRITSWKTFRKAENTFAIEIIIFAMDERIPKKINIENIMCPEFDSKVWLWPFRERITKIQKRLNDLCKKSQDHFETLKRIEELSEKVKFLRTGVAIYKELEKKKTLPSFSN